MLYAGIFFKTNYAFMLYAIMLYAGIKAYMLRRPMTNGCLGPYENIEGTSGSVKKSEWQEGSGYKFDQHVYIPLGGQSVTDWEILLKFSEPVHLITVWVVKAEKVDSDGRQWKLTSLSQSSKFISILF